MLVRRLIFAAWQMSLNVNEHTAAITSHLLAVSLYLWHRALFLCHISNLREGARLGCGFCCQPGVDGTGNSFWAFWTILASPLRSDLVPLSRAAAFPDRHTGTYSKLLTLDWYIAVGRGNRWLYPRFYDTHHGKFH